MEDLSDRNLSDLMDAVEEHGMAVVGKEWAEGIEQVARQQGAEEVRERLHSRLRKLALKYGEPTRYELLEVARELAALDQEVDHA